MRVRLSLCWDSLLIRYARLKVCYPVIERNRGIIFNSLTGFVVPFLKKVRSIIEFSGNLSDNSRPCLRVGFTVLK